MNPKKLTFKVQWFKAERLADGQRRLSMSVNRPGSLDSEDVVALVSETGEGNRILTLEELVKHTRSNARTSRVDYQASPIPTVSVSPYGGEETPELSSLWDRITLTPMETDVVEGLRIIDPRISAVNMVGGEGRSRERVAKVRINNDLLPIPLRSFGDGMNRLFAIILALVNARGGLLLIDEFENGLHYTVQLDAWRMVFQLAQKLDVQVFATSHSMDTIEAFQKAAYESPEEGIYLRLSRWRDGIINLAWGEEELTTAVRHRIEMR